MLYPCQLRSRLNCSMFLFSKIVESGTPFLRGQTRLHSLRGIASIQNLDYRNAAHVQFLADWDHIIEEISEHLCCDWLMELVEFVDRCYCSLNFPYQVALDVNIDETKFWTGNWSSIEKFIDALFYIRHQYVEFALAGDGSAGSSALGRNRTFPPHNFCDFTYLAARRLATSDPEPTSTRTTPPPWESILPVIMSFEAPRNDHS